ncbi:MAG: hypothetical protein AAFY71_21805 [Bacteroidota bacterium]
MEAVKEKTLATGMKDAAFRKLCSELNKKLQLYLVGEQLKSEKFVHQQLWEKISEERGLHDQAKSARKKQRKILEDEPTNTLNLFRKFEIEGSDYTDDFQEGKKLNQLSFDQYAKAFDLMIIHERIQNILQYEQTVRKGSEEIVEKPWLYEEILIYLESNPSYVEEAGVSFVLRYIHYLKGERGISKIDLAQSFKNEYHKLDKNFASNLFGVLISIYGRDLRQEWGPKNMNDAYELYTWGLEEELLLFENHFHKSHFHNLITYSLYLNKSEDTKRYIKELSPLLHPGVRDDYIMLANCLLDFHTGKYEKVFKLRLSSFPNPTVELGCRILVIKSLYDSFGPDKVDKTEVEAELKAIRNRIYSAKNISEGNKQYTLNRWANFYKLMKTENFEERLKLWEEIKVQAGNVDTDWFKSHLTQVRKNN